MMKSTYGTGCFAVLNTGADIVRSKNRLLTTIAYRLDGKTTYALEGSIFIAGAAVQWLRDGAEDHRQGGRTAAQLAGDGRRYAERLSRAGLHRPRRAALGCRCARRDLRPDAQFRSGRIRPRRAGSRRLPDARPARRDEEGLEGRGRRAPCCGSMAAWSRRTGPCSAWPTFSTRRSTGRTILETTALGAAWLAGSRAGVWPQTAEFARSWALERRFEPEMDEKTRSAKIKGWRDAVRRTLTTP